MTYEQKLLALSSLTVRGQKKIYFCIFSVESQLIWREEFSFLSAQASTFGCYRKFDESVGELADGLEKLSKVYCPD